MEAYNILENVINEKDSNENKSKLYVHLKKSNPITFVVKVIY